MREDLAKNSTSSNLGKPESSQPPLYTIPKVAVYRAEGYRAGLKKHARMWILHSNAGRDPPGRCKKHEMLIKPGQGSTEAGRVMTSPGQRA